MTAIDRDRDRIAWEAGLPSTGRRPTRLPLWVLRTEFELRRLCASVRVRLRPWWGRLVVALAFALLATALRPAADADDRDGPRNPPEERVAVEVVGARPVPASLATGVPTFAPTGSRVTLRLVVRLPRLGAVLRSLGEECVWNVAGRDVAVPAGQQRDLDLIPSAAATAELLLTDAVRHAGSCVFALPAALPVVATEQATTPAPPPSPPPTRSPAPERRAPSPAGSPSPTDPSVIGGIVGPVLDWLSGG